MVVSIFNRTENLSVLRRGGWLVMLLVLLVSQSPLVAASGLSAAQRKLLQEHINYFNINNCSTASGAAPSPTGGVAFDDSQSSDTGNQTTIDDDGIDPSPTGSPDHQGSTSYADGKLGALHTNYIALNPGWASANGIVLGDVAALTYKGNTVYAVYGDNHVGNTPHAEISVKAAMGLTGITDPAKVGSLTGVHFIVYPGTNTQLAGSVNQSRIDQIGAAVSGAGSPSGGSASPSVDLNTIASTYNLQSAIVKQVGGSVVASYHADRPPATPASVLKLLIADVFLHTNPDLSKTVTIKSGELYSPSDATAGQRITLHDVINRTLSEESWNTGANILIDQVGSFSATTASAHSLGYTSTDINNYYHDPPAGANKTTVSDLSKAMEDLFTQSGSGYSVAQGAMSGENHFNISPSPAASKWGGTSNVAGNSGLFDINGKKYIVALYINGQESSSPPSTAFTGIKNASEAIVKALGGTSTSSSTTPGCCAGASTSFGPGTLPSSVPNPYNSIFTAAATAAGIEPALLAGIFYGGEHGNSFPDPPPPYGHGGPWASSGVPSSGSQDWPTQPPGPGAAGPFQFEYPTWQKYGVSASGKGGQPDVEDLIDAAFGAANYLAASGAKNTTDPAKLQQAILAYNPSSAYVSSVMAAYTKFGGGSSPPPSPSPGTGSPSSGCSTPSSASGGFTNPFPGGWQPNRLDMGYDGTFTGQIVAPFSGTITYADSSFSNWGGYIEIKADSPISALPTSTLYFAEGLKPAVWSGHVDAGTPIADAVPSRWNGISGNIEWGVAKDGPVGTPTDTYVYGQCGSSAAKSAVLAFAQWAQSTLNLPPPTETGNAGCP